MDEKICQECDEEEAVTYCMNCETYICEHCLCECNK